MLQYYSNKTNFTFIGTYCNIAKIEISDLEALFARRCLLH